MPPQPHEQESRLLKALRAHVMKEKQRKREEHEAEIEEERLRKEREARERQNVMTLGETREQIKKLEIKLKDLHSQKQSLFLQLKKVLNEDETWKKKKKENEMALQMHMQPISSNTGTVFPPKQPHSQLIIQKGISFGNKRPRSPSPPPLGRKILAIIGLPKKEHDDRRNDVSRVLWKQPAVQYQNTGTLFYQTTPNPPDNRTGVPPPIIFPTYNMPIRNYHLEMPQQAQANQGHLQKNDLQAQAQQRPTQVFHINLDQPVQKNANPHKPQVTMERIPSDRSGYHVEVKLDQQSVYSNLMRGGIPNVMHPNVIQQMPSNQAQNAKTGIAQNYPNNRLSQQQQLSVQPSQPQHHYQRRINYP